MKNITKKLFLLLSCIATSCHTQNSEIDFSKVSWITLSESMSYYYLQKSENYLEKTDTITIEFIGELDEKFKLCKLKNDIPAISFTLADTIKMYNLSPIWSKLTKNSETFVKIDYSSKIHRMLDSCRNITISLNKNDTSQIDLLVDYLNKKYYSENVTIMSKEEAAHELNEELGCNVMSDLGFNPFPKMIKLKIKKEYLDSNSIEKIRKDIKLDYRINDVGINDIGILVKRLKERVKVIKIKTNC